jgi:hypothetical protein
MKRIPQPLAGHIAPQCPHLLGLQREQAGTSPTRAAASRFTIERPIPGISSSFSRELSGHVFGIPDRQTIGLLGVAGDLGQVPVGGKADRAGQCRADVVADGVLDPLGKVGGLAPLGLVQPARDFVDRLHLVDRDHRPISEIRALCALR